tara:strand:- start:490 stop:1422 length:933 start_codon:yes stop_codon:yes gene_type:complete
MRKSGKGWLGLSAAQLHRQMNRLPAYGDLSYSGNISEARIQRGDSIEYHFKESEGDNNVYLRAIPKRRRKPVQIGLVEYDVFGSEEFCREFSIENFHSFIISEGRSALSGWPLRGKGGGAETPNDAQAIDQPLTSSVSALSNQAAGTLSDAASDSRQKNWGLAPVPTALAIMLGIVLVLFGEPISELAKGISSADSMGSLRKAPTGMTYEAVGGRADRSQYNYDNGVYTTRGLSKPTCSGYQVICVFVPIKGREEAFAPSLNEGYCFGKTGFYGADTIIRNPYDGGYMRTSRLRCDRPLDDQNEKRGLRR